MTQRTGRPRHYDIGPTAEYSDREIGFHAAWLAELRERVIDQISELTPTELNYVSAETRLSVARLARHLAWGEVAWMGRVGGPKPVPYLSTFLGTDALSAFANEPEPVGSADELVSAIRRVADEVVGPTLGKAAGIDAVVIDDGTTLRGVLMHLEWHWVYHSGQIGLLQFECGSDYEWTMHRPMAPQV